MSRRPTAPWGLLESAVDVRRDTPVWAVQRYLGHLQAGATARALAQYLPAVWGRVGLRRLALALEQVGANRALGQKKLRLIARGPRTARLSVAIDQGDAEAERYRFTLVRRSNRWWIAYDDLTRDSFAGAEELKDPSRDGVAAGRRARRLFVAATERALRAESRP